MKLFHVLDRSASSSVFKRENTDNKYIIKQVKKKNLSPFIEWIEVRNEKYYKIGWSYLYNNYDIEDAMQNTIIKVYEKISQLKEEKYFETWVTSIFINECKTLLRRRKREDFIHNVEVIDAPCEDISNIEFKEIINELEDIYKEVIVLKYISNYSQEEMAEILGIPIGTVKSRIGRGLSSLRKMINKEVF